MKGDVKSWLDANKWYLSDEVATHYADAVAMQLRADGVKTVGVPFLEEVARRVAGIVPDRVKPIEAAN